MVLVATKKGETMKKFEYLNCEEEDTEDTTYDEPCPDCKAPLVDAPGGGVKCTKCDYWFCF